VKPRHSVNSKSWFLFWANGCLDAVHSDVNPARRLARGPQLPQFRVQILVLVGRGPRQLESGCQLRLKRTVSLLKSETNGQSSPSWGPAEAGPAVGSAPRCGKRKARSRPDAVGDVSGWTLMGGVEVADGPLGEPLLLPQVLRQLEVGGRLGYGWRAGRRPTTTSQG